MNVTPRQLASLLPLTCVVLLCCARPQPCTRKGVDAGPAPSARHVPVAHGPGEPSPAFECDARRYPEDHLPKAPPPAPSKPSHTVDTKQPHGILLSNPTWHWSLTLPADWTVASDSGSELVATSAAKNACVHLLSMQWQKRAQRQPSALGFVGYWQHYEAGSAFPMYAAGAQVSETDVGKTRDGHYLRYEFDDTKNGMCYLQTYASAGGPNGLVASTRVKCAELTAMRGVLDGILGSATLLPEKS